MELIATHSSTLEEGDTSKRSGILPEAASTLLMIVCCMKNKNAESEKTQPILTVKQKIKIRSAIKVDRLGTEWGYQRNSRP